MWEDASLSENVKNFVSDIVVSFRRWLRYGYLNIYMMYIEEPDVLSKKLNIDDIGLFRSDFTQSSVCK